MGELNSRDSLAIVVTTESNLENAKALSSRILEKKYAGCISLKEIQSAFWWGEKIEESNEIQLIIKTKLKIVEELFKFIKSIHTYNNPELIYWEINSSKNYHNWLDNIIHLKDSL